MFCRTFANLLSPEECESFIARGESTEYQLTGRDYPVSYRNNDRLIKDDPTLASTLFARLRDQLPQTLLREGVEWQLEGLNPRFRGCRYSNGQSFTRHRDGAYSPDVWRRSFLTLMLYLNDASEFQGGATRFYNDRFTTESEFEVAPQQGLAILFAHDFWHDGQAVVDGTKYVLRTDVIYRTSTPLSQAHRGYVWDVKQLQNGALVTGSRDKTVRVWREAATRQPRVQLSQTLRGHESSVTCLAAFGDGFFSGGRDRTIVAWSDEGDGRFAKQRAWKAHEGSLLRLLPLADGTLLSSAADGEVAIWTPQGQRLTRWQLDSWPWSVVQLSDSRLLAGTESGDLWLIDPELQKPELVYSSEAAILSLCPLGNGQLLVGDGAGGLSRLQRHPDGTFALVERLRDHRGPITSIALLACGAAVTGAEDDGVRIWSQSGSIEILRHTDFVRSLCVTREQRIVSVSYDGSLQSSSPSAILRRLRAAKPGGAISGTAAAS